jgi:hypothetical protein
MMRLTRRPLMFIIDSLHDDKGLERRKMMVDNPLGGTFRVSNGKLTADITFSELGIEVNAVNENGEFETIYTKKV